MHPKINQLINKFKSRDQEKEDNIIALVPLFFNWLIIFSKNEISLNCRNSCLRAGLFSFGFFVLLFTSFIFSLIPLIGSYIANLIHLIAVCLYLSLSGFFIYAIYKEKKVEIKFVDKAVLKLNEIMN